MFPQFKERGKKKNLLLESLKQTQKFKKKRINDPYMTL